MHSTYDLNDGYFGSGKILKRSLNKYGIDNHIIEILEYCNDREDLIKKEKIYVNEDLIKDVLCMNLMRGGKGGFISDEQQKARSIAGGKAFANKLKIDEAAFKKRSETSSLNIKNLHTKGKIKYNTFEGKEHSEEAKNKISEANKISQLGEKNSQYGTCWIYKNSENKKIKKEELNTYLNSGWIKGRV
jgi:hypothetical protein